jgi:hypothetical protein
VPTTVLLIQTAPDPLLTRRPTSPASDRATAEGQVSYRPRLLASEVGEVTPGRALGVIEPTTSSLSGRSLAVAVQRSAEREADHRHHGDDSQYAQRQGEHQHGEPSPGLEIEEGVRQRAGQRREPRGGS